MRLIFTEPRKRRYRGRSEARGASEVAVLRAESVSL